MHQGWPAVLSEGSVGLRPLRMRDSEAWVEIRRGNEDWLRPWEATPTLVAEPWARTQTRATYIAMVRRLTRAARLGECLPFAVTYEGALVGQLTIGSIVRGAFKCGYAGYWVDQAVAGRGVMPTALALAVDHCFGAVGLHRVEVNIRPENRASRRVVEKLGFREEGLHLRYLAIDGAYRDHIGYALTAEDVPGGLLARWRQASAAAAISKDVDTPDAPK